MMIRKQGRRGWVLITVLLTLMLISLLVASFYATSTDSASISRAMVGREIAMSHADTGLQEALRAMRSEQLDLLSAITGPCSSAEVDANSCAMTLSSPLVDHGASEDLGENGGLQYEYVIYRRLNASDPGQPANRLVVRSIGYYGYSMTSANLITSVVEAEVDVGRGSRFECVGGYECQ